MKNIRKSFLISSIWFTAALLGVSLINLSSGITKDDTLKRGFAVLEEVFVNGNTISVRTDKSVPYNIFKIGSPPRLVLDLTNTENEWKKKTVKLKDNPIFNRVRSGQFQNKPVKIARVVIELKSAVDFQSTAEDGIITLTIVKKGEEVKALPDKEKKSVKTPKGESMAMAPTPAEVVKTDPKTSPLLVQAIPQGERDEFDEDEEEAPMIIAKKIRKKIAPPLRPGTSDPSSLFGRQRVTLDFYDIKIVELFKILSQKSGVNIVYSDGMEGTISIQLNEVPFKDAIETILSLKNLRMVMMGRNIVQVMTPKEHDNYKTNAISITKVFPINYAKAEDVNTQLTSILTTLGGKGKTLVDSRTNSIIVTDTPKGIDTIAKLVEDLDKPTPQVMIEAKIIEVSLGRNLDLGINWGAAYSDRSGSQMVTIGASEEKDSADPILPGSGALGLQTRSALNPSGTSGLEEGGSGFTGGGGLGLTFGFVKDVVRLNAAISALAQKRKLRTLSNPKIATLNNQSAVISSKTREPYITTETTLIGQGGATTAQKVNQSESGITLTVTPTINADGRITMKIVPDITSSVPTSIGIPKTTSQRVDTTVIVKDGETFVIGGLIRESESNEKSYIPVLGRIPILGHLFKKTGTAKSRAELLVFITPTIIPY